MGVRGLTSYIYYKENIYFDDVILKDCTLIVDGNSLAPHLYNSGLMHSSAFGGDYDKIGELTERFFKRLIYNNVYPIVVFDGAVEKRKITTVRTRSKSKVISLQSVTPSNYNSQCFPMFMRKAMRGKLIDMGIVVLQSDLEADSEIAALAKLYNAPVLSNDSDYFIFDVLYIPIPKLMYNNGTNSEIKGKMFKTDKFLQYLDLDRTKLILLAVVLGNDYIKRSELAPFLGQIKLDKSRPGAFTQKVISGLIRWLKSESVESALQKILSCMRSRGRQFLRQKIIKIMRGYTNLTTVLQNYIPNDPKIKPFQQQVNSESIEETLNNLTIDSQVDELGHVESGDEKPVEEAVAQEKDSSSGSISYCNSEVEDAEGESINFAEVEQILQAGQECECGISRSPNWLLNRSRKGLVSPDILTILNLKTYFSTPQPEFYEMSYSGEPYTPLLQSVVGLLLGNDVFQYWHRQHRNKYERRTVETTYSTVSYGTFPSLEHIGKLSLGERRTIFNEIMKVDDSNLKQVPEDWKLYFVSVMHWLHNDVKNEIKPYHLHSVVLMMVTLLVVDERIGFHRQRKTFIKTYGAAISKIQRIRGSLKPSAGGVSTNLTEALQKVTKDDCILSFDTLLQSFVVDRQTQRSKTFSNGLIHTFAQLQCCMAFTSMLNDALSQPYPDLKIHKFYNGTFLYNVASNFKNRANISSYMESFFMKTPSVLAVYMQIFETFQQCFPDCVQRKSKKKSRKPKTTPTLITGASNNTDIMFNSDSEPFFDKNNRFSVLLS